MIPNVPAINLVRDPISILKSFLNYKRQREFRDIFTLSCAPSSILENRVGYGFYTDIKPLPSLESLPFWCFDRMMCFHDGLMLKDCVQVHNVYYLDMQDIIGENAYKNMHKLAQHLKLEIPKECDEEFFARRIADFEFLLPIRIYAHWSDIDKLRNGFSNDLEALQLQGGITINITTCYALAQEDSVEITHLFFEETIMPIMIMISLKDYESFLQNEKLQGVICEYVRLFVKEVFIKIDKEKAKRLTEEDVLKYFQACVSMRQAFREATEAYLEVLHTRKPKMIQRWKYYKAFLKICKESG